MPELVHYSAITDLTPFNAGTTQVLSTCRFNGLEWFFKQPPTLLIDAKARTLRILNEAICGAIVLFLNERSHNPFLTPVHRLVVDGSGSPIGVLSQKITYETFMDRGTDKGGLKSALAMKGLAEISTVRFCIGDPDGNNNAGYGEKGGPLSSIDYGLANFSYLFAQNALTESEKTRLPIRGPSIFDITIDNVLSFILEPVGDDVEFLAHHAFPMFERYLAEFCETNRGIVEGFFSNVYKMLNIVSVALTAGGFKNRIFATLGLDGLSEDDSVLCQNIIGVLIERAHHLRLTLRTLSSYSPNDFEKLAAKSPSDERFSPAILSASPVYKRLTLIDQVNEMMRVRAEAERFSSIRTGRITPANGGGEDGYKGVLFPTPTSPRRRTLRVDRAGSFDEPLESFSLGSPL